MNSFDFSLYDPEDNTVISAKEEKKSPEKPKSNVESFDFSAYDLSTPAEVQKIKTPAEESTLNDEIYQKYYKVPDYTAEQTKKMSIRERMQLNEDLKREREYLSSKGIVKGALSGATLGASENIEALKSQPHELNTGFGEFVGSLAPISATAKAVSIPIKAGFKNAPKVLKPLQNFLQAFATGSTYESGKQAVNAASGHEVNLSQIPTRGAEFATIDAFLRGSSALAKKFLQFSPAHQAQILEQEIIPEDLPKSQYETAEEMLNLLKQTPKKSSNISDNFPPGSPPPGAPPAAPLTNRKLSPPKDIGLRPTTSEPGAPLHDQVGDVFSKNKFYNTTEGGKSFKKEIMNIDEDVYRGVNELYKISRELNSEIDSIHPQLVSSLENRLKELKQIPEPSDVQKRLIKAQEKILKNLVEYEPLKDEAGNVIGQEITGYKPINNQTLIDQIQSLRQIIDYDFAHGNTKNIFKPLINDLQDSAIRAAEGMGNPEAAEALGEARSAYRAWAEAFDNDYVRPFRDASNQDFSKLFKSALDFDESNMLRKILTLSDNGKQLADASVREIVDKHLSKYFDNPKAFNSREFDKVLRELEAVITPEQAFEIKTKFIEANKSPKPIRAKAPPKRQPTNDEMIAAKYSEREVEDIQDMMNSRTGIRQLRQFSSKDPVRKQVFDRLSKQKIRSILREGNIEKDFTGDDLYKLLNKEKNYELLSEILGEAETENLRLAAKEIGKQQVKSEVRKKNITKAAHKIAVFKTLEILLGLL